MGDIDPARAAYAFANRFVNVVVTLPGGRPLRTAGRCGGMSYSMLDHLAAGQDVPVWPPALFAPGTVPPDGHVVADHLKARQLDSFRTLSALRFLAWSVLPDRDLGPVRGVRTLTHRQLPGVLRALAQGRPVVLGLVVATNLLRAGDNHQVVATGFRRDAEGGLVLTLLDPNTPRREVTLVETPEGWRASNGRLWRGFFHHSYARRTPPPLPSASRRPTARVRSGAPLALAHVATGRLLVVAGGVPVLRAAGATTWAPTSGGDGVLTDGAVVRLVPVGAQEPDGDDGTTHLSLGVVDGTPRLVDSPPPRVDGTPVPVDGPATPVDSTAAPGTTESPDAWRVVVDGAGPWREESRVRLVHTTTGALLAGSPSGVRTTFDPDPSTWWTTAAH